MKDNQSKLNFCQFMILGLIFISLALGQLTRFNFISGAIYPHDFFIAIFLLIEAFRINKNKLGFGHLKQQIEKIGPSFRLEAVALFWLLISLIYHSLLPAHNLALIYDGRIFYYSLFIIALVRRRRIWSKRLSLARYPWFFGLISFITLFGFIQYKFFYDLRLLFFLGWDDHLGRLVSTLLDPNFAGFLIAIGLIYWQSLRFKYKIQFWFYWFVNAIFVLALSLTFSRASYLAALLGLTFLTFLGRRRRLRTTGGLLIALLILTIVFVPKPKSEGGNLWRTASIKARIIHDVTIVMPSWRNQLKQQLGPQPKETKTALAIPATSLTKILPTTHAQEPNNLEVFIYQQTGLLGLILFLLLLLKWSKRLYQYNHLDFIFLMMLFLHTQFNNTALEPFVFLIFWGTFTEALGLKLNI